MPARRSSSCGRLWRQDLRHADPAVVAYAESAERGVSIVDHRPDLGADYLSLADEVLERLGRGDDRKALAKLRAELAPAA